MPSKPQSRTASRADTPAAKPQRKASTGKSKKERPSGRRLVQRISTVLSSRAFQFIVGLLLMVCVLYALYAMLFYPVYGGEDQSVLHAPKGNELRGPIQNPAGILGARLAELLINDWFGYSSVIILFFLTMVALRLMHVVKRPLWRTFLTSVFWLVWTSTAIGFLTHSLYTDGHSFYCWGGHFGEAVSQWLVSYIREVGTLLVLVGTLLAFMVLTYKNTLPRLAKAWQHIAARLQPKKRTDDPVDITSPADSTDVSFNTPTGLFDTTNADPSSDAVTIDLEDVEIFSEDIPGWTVANDGALTVALDITVTDELRNEGVARELVKRIQNLRKESGFEITDRINICLAHHELTDRAVATFGDYIRAQVLAENLTVVDVVENPVVLDFEDFKLEVNIQRQ